MLSPHTQIDSAHKLYSIPEQKCIFKTDGLQSPYKYDMSFMVTLFSPSSRFPIFFSPSVQHLQASIDRAVAYLERRLPDLTNPYAVAITSYALANENKLNLEILKNCVSSGVFTHKYYSTNSAMVRRCKDSESVINY